MDKIDSYDLFMSVGIDCRPAIQLKRAGLRKKSFPLDWQMRYSLDTVIHLFQTKFEDFFVDIEEDIEREGSNNNRWVVDTNNI